MADRYALTKKNRQGQGGGRPLKFIDVATLQAAIDDYFALIKVENRPMTITGLAAHLHTTRESLLDYGCREKFSDAIKEAKMKIQAHAEEHLYKPGLATGMIFNLVNNWGWQNKSVTEAKVDQRVISTTSELTEEELDKKLKDLSDRIAKEKDSTNA